MSEEFIKFHHEYERQEAERAARDEKRRAAENGSRQRKIQVRRDLVMYPTTDWDYPKYTGNDSADEITKKCMNAWMTFRGSWSPTAEVSEEFLKQFLNANLSADITNPDTYTDAVNYITEKLRECESVEPTVTRKQRQGATRVDGTIEYEDVPEPEAPKAEAPVTAERNPYIWGTKAYTRFEKQRRQRALHNQVLEKACFRSRS